MAVAALSLTSSPPASADGPPVATNFRNDDLTDRPTYDMATAYATRSIKLAAGTYWWNESTDDVRWHGRYIDLAAGDYTWVCALDPEQDYYLFSCSLTRAGGGAAYLPTQKVYLYHSTPGSLQRHQWGGSLYPQF